MESAKKAYLKMAAAARLHDPIIYEFLVEYSPHLWLPRKEVESAYDKIYREAVVQGTCKELPVSREEWDSGINRHQLCEKDVCTFEIVHHKNWQSHTLTDLSREFHKIELPTGRSGVTNVYYASEVVKYDLGKIKIELAGRSSIEAYDDKLMFRAVNQGVTHAASFKHEEIVFSKTIRA